jgi:hypothetical protein
MITKSECCIDTEVDGGCVSPMKKVEDMASPLRIRTSRYGDGDCIQQL